VGGEGGSAGVGEGGSAGGGAALVDTFEAYLVGRFDSTAQAKKDPSFFEIQVETCRVEVPALGARVLYIEQAQLAALDQPYRQRLYVLEAGEDPATQVVSRVFEFKTASKYIGLCGKEPAPVISAAQTEEKAGCAVRMAWDGAQFVGGTVGKGCPSALSGATYATSEVTLRADGFTSWDRGYDAADKQVWGAVKAATCSIEKTPLAP
jgi:CpeT protein